VFDRAIFKDKKKRYAMHIVDKEGKRLPKGHRDELKIVGMETRRSDTPKYIQDFLTECLTDVLVDGIEEEELRTKVEAFREEFRKIPAWKRGSPVRLNNFQVTCKKIEEFEKAQEDHDFSAKKPLSYYAVIAAKNTNALMDLYREQRWEKLREGDKIEILSLLKNDYGIEKVAIRVGEDYVPEWFKALPFDDNFHEKRQIDQKLDNIFGALNWNFDSVDHNGYSIFF
jgi:DNA polymerase elongation subunit (family B)